MSTIPGPPVPIAFVGSSIYDTNRLFWERATDTNRFLRATGMNESTLVVREATCHPMLSRMGEELIRPSLGDRPAMVTRLARGSVERVFNPFDWARRIRLKPMK